MNPATSQPTLANLFIVGAPKCGTTAWWQYLSRHPQVYMSRPKEPHHFSSDFPRFQWVKDRVAYAELFKSGAACRIRGEASVMYLYSSVAAQGIAEYNSAARIIVCVRDHARFLSSYHRQLLLNLDEDVVDLNEALAKEPERREGRSIPKKCREGKFLWYSEIVRFAPQLQRYLDHFPSNQILLLRLERWTQSPDDTWLQVQKFLGLDVIPFHPLEPVNEGRAAHSRILSNLYRQPTESFKRVVRTIRTLGIDTRALAKHVRRYNESKATPLTVELKLPRQLSEVFRSDSEHMDSLLRNGRIEIVPR